MGHRAGLSRQRSRLASSRLIVFSSSRRMPPPGWSTPAHKLNSTAVQDSQEHGFGAASRRTADGREPLPVPEPPVPTVGHMPPLVKSVALRLKAHVAGKAERVGRTVAVRASRMPIIGKSANGMSEVAGIGIGSNTHQTPQSVVTAAQSAARCSMPDW